MTAGRAFADKESGAGAAAFSSPDPPAPALPDAGFLLAPRALHALHR
jgi:hypothetical protein